MSTDLEPRLVRSINFQMKGDWGAANLHRTCGWISDFLVKHAGPDTRVGIWNGLGGKDNVDAVANGDVDLALATPARFVSAALRGTYPFDGAPRPSIRALAVLPQDDVMVLGVAASVGPRTIEEIHTARPALTIAVPPDDGRTFMGMGAHRHLEALGLDKPTVESWGGRFLEIEDPGRCLAAVSRGEANAVMHEAIMGPWWRDAVAKVGVRLVATPEAALDALEQSFGWTRRTLAKGYFETLDGPVTTLDFSDFLVIVDEHMPEDLAYLLTWGIVQTRDRLEQQYRHIKPEWSPLTYPLEPARMARSPVSLHAGARRFYERAGLL